MAIKKLLVSLGNVSAGQAVARIGATIPIEKLSLEEARDLFVQKRLYGKLILRKGQDDSEQTYADGDAPREIDAIFDSKNLRVGGKDYGIGLSFQIDDKIERNLLYFAKRSAYLRVANAVELVSEADKATNPVVKDKPGQGRLAGMDVPPAKAADDAPVDALGLPAALTKALIGAGYETVGAVKKAHKADKLVDVLTEVQTGRVLAAIQQVG